MLETVAYSPLSPTEQWKIPRWVLTTAGLFFASAAVLTVVSCVVLLRDTRTANRPPRDALDQLFSESSL